MPIQSTRSRTAWIESAATTVRAELLARQPQVGGGRSHGHRQHAAAARV